MIFYMTSNNELVICLDRKSCTTSQIWHSKQSITDALIEHVVCHLLAYLHQLTTYYHERIRTGELE